MIARSRRALDILEMNALTQFIHQESMVLVKIALERRLSGLGQESLTWSTELLNDCLMQFLSNYVDIKLKRTGLATLRALEAMPVQQLEQALMPILEKIVCQFLTDQEQKMH